MLNTIIFKICIIYLHTQFFLTREKNSLSSQAPWKIYKMTGYCFQSTEHRRLQNLSFPHFLWRSVNNKIPGIEQVEKNSTQKRRTLHNRWRRLMIWEYDFSKERKKEEWRKEFQLLFLEKKKIPPSCNKNNTENMKTAALE